MYALGVVLFAVSLLAAVCLHEAGHMFTAKAFGMKVTQYFAGFGPTLWSMHRGETEYGVKAIPAGGFVKIVGMTPLEQVEPGDDQRSFWRFPLWQRTIVLAAGSVTHFLLAILVAYAAALTAGIPDISGANSFDKSDPAVITVADCAYASTTQLTCTAADATGPAKAAGLRDGDRILSVGTTAVRHYKALLPLLRKLPATPVTVTYERNGVTATTAVTPQRVSRPPLDATGPTDPRRETVSAVGISQDVPKFVKSYGPLAAVGPTASYLGQTVTGTFASLKLFPEKLPKVWDAVRGAKRDSQTPISVVGASRIGGESLQAGALWLLLSLFVSLNVFIGIFNLGPLLPLDGGHIVIAWFERARSLVARRRGRPDPGRVDYNKLLPLTYLVIAIFAVVSLLTLAADIVNPIRIQ